LKVNEPFAAAAYIREIGRGAKGARSLTQQDTHAVFSAMLDGRISDLELGALLLAWRIKGETVEELAGMLDAAHASCGALACAAAPWSGGTASALPVVIPSYNGARKQPNLVPLLALLLAAAGVPVLVHGITTFPGRITSATLFEALGVPICASLQEAETQLADRKLAFVPINVLSPSIAGLLAKRNILGLRNSAHTIVKMLQPLADHAENRAIRLVNYTHPEYLQVLCDYFGNKPANALLMRGTEGEAVADARRLGRMLWIGNKQQVVVTEGEKGSVPASAYLPAGLSIADTCAYIGDVVSGKQPVPEAIAAQVAFILQAAQCEEGKCPFPSIEAIAPTACP